MTDISATQQINEIISETSGWRGKALADVRKIINEADPAIIEA